MLRANIDPSTRRFVRTAVLAAIILLLALTPLGYLIIGPIAATTVQMPVIIGAALLGPGAGAVLGGFFGFSSVLKVAFVPGADPVATAIMAVQPFLYVVIALVPRIGMGFLSGEILRGLRRVPKLKESRFRIYCLTGAAGSMLNTTFYLGGLWLLAGRYISQVYQMDVSRVGLVVLGSIVTLGIPEALISALVVGAACRALKASDPSLF